MASRRKAMTVRERQLSDELQRIRSTYSFQLGLLLTETFVRKPWRILLFPFLFVALNLRFLRQRNQNTTGTDGEHQSSTDRNCVLLFPTSEEGIASLERCGLIAKEWVVEHQRKVVVISSHPEAKRYLPADAIVYPIKDPKKEKQHQRGEWNARCENLLSSILETYRPANALFDGPFPYRGVVNIAEYYPNTVWCWLRPEGLSNDALKSRSSAFHSIVKFCLEGGDGARLLDRVGTPTKTDVKPVILDGLGYGHKGKSNMAKKIDLGRLLPAAIQVVEQGVEQKYTPLLNNQHLSELTAAVVPPNIEVISSLLAANVPTLCLYNEQTSTETMAMLRRSCAREAVLFCQEHDEHQLRVNLSTLLESNDVMRSKSYGFEPTMVSHQLFRSEHRGTD